MKRVLKGVRRALLGGQGKAPATGTFSADIKEGKERAGDWQSCGRMFH